MIMMVLKIIYSNLTNLIFISYTKTYLFYILSHNLTVIRNDFNYIYHILFVHSQKLFCGKFISFYYQTSHILCE